MGFIRLAKKTPILRKALLKLIAINRPAATGGDAETQSVDPVTARDSVDAIRSEIEKDGIYIGLTLDCESLAEVKAYSENADCFADRDPERPFRYASYDDACKKYNKPILVAQYFNAVRACPVIRSISESALLKRIADAYLGVDSVFLGSNLWWTFACTPSDEDVKRHAHLFHYDIDDLKFIKFFFCITNVTLTSGAHFVVKGSHHDRAFRRPLFSSPRISDEWVEEHFGNKVMAVLGNAGDGFAEDTYMLHKGSTPTTGNRLMLQLEFGVLRHKHQSDVR